MLLGEKRSDRMSRAQLVLLLALANLNDITIIYCYYLHAKQCMQKNLSAYTYFTHSNKYEWKVEACELWNYVFRTRTNVTAPSIVNFKEIPLSVAS